jgi:hypothetical protein
MVTLTFHGLSCLNPRFPPPVGGNPGNFDGSPGTFAGSPGTFAGSPGTLGGNPANLAGPPSKLGGSPAELGGSPAILAGSPSELPGRPAPFDGISAIVPLPATANQELTVHIFTHFLSVGENPSSISLDKPREDQSLPRR